MLPSSILQIIQSLMSQNNSGGSFTTLPIGGQSNTVNGGAAAGVTGGGGIAGPGSLTSLGVAPSTPSASGSAPSSNSIPLIGINTSAGLPAAIPDVQGQLQQAATQLANGQITYPQYEQIFNQINSNTGGPALSANTKALAGQDFSNFYNETQTLTGAPPTPAEISQWFNQVAPSLNATPGMATNTADVTSANNAFLENTLGPQITQYQQGQEQGALNTALGSATGVVNSQIQNALTQLTNPQTMQQIEQSLNNSGMLNSGALSTTIGNDLANSAQGDISSLLGSVAAPALSGQVSTATDPYQGFLSQIYPGLSTVGNTQQASTNFNQLAQLLQSVMGGSGSGSSGSSGGLSSLINLLPQGSVQL